MPTCLCCKKEIPRKTYSHKAWLKLRFCSRECFAKSRIGYLHTKETKLKLSKAHKGTKKPWSGKYKHSEEHNQKIKDSLLNFYTENPNYLKGRIISEDTRKKISDSTKGKKHWNWKGGDTTFKKRNAFYQRQREYIKKANGGSHTLEEWENLKKQFNYSCLRCKRMEPEISLTEDHIIPITSGGSNYIYNIQPLCHSCNSKKGTKLIGWIFRYQPTI